MANLGEAVEALIATSPLPKPKREHVAAPKGWEPGVAWDGDHGTITTKPLTKRPDDWDDLLRVWDLDPAKYEVVEPVQYRAWDSNMGEGNVQRMYYYRATIRTRILGERADVDALINEIKRHKPVKRVARPGDKAFAVIIADPQIGKNDGDGTAGTVRRIENAIDRVTDRYKELRRIGRGLGQLHVLFLGDLFENCDGYYAQQAFRVELNRRDQEKLGRRLFVSMFQHWSPDFERVVGAAVGGNHGENRREGQSFTDFADNADVGVIEQVAEVLGANPERYGHVNFVLPNHELDVTLDIAGTITTLVHGHQFGGKKRIKTPATQVGDKALNWWASQAHGMRPAGESTLLLSGHFHHFLVTQEGAKTHMQAPALDGGSEWYTNRSGQDSPAGVLTMTIGPDGWDDLKIL
jgi:hypothetical protein